MRGASLVGVALVLAGCGEKSPCDGTSDLCVELRVDGDGAGIVTRVDQLALTVLGDFRGARRVTPETPEERTLPVDVALLLPRGTRGAVSVRIDALFGGQVVGDSTADLLLESDAPLSRHVILRALEAPPPDGGVDLPSPEQSDGPTTPPDLTPVAPPACPAVMFIVDRTGSMDTQVPGSAMSRLDVAKQGISSAIGKHAGRFVYGLTTFSNDANSMCTVGVDVRVTPRIDSASMIVGVLGTLQPDGLTRRSSTCTTSR